MSTAISENDDAAYPHAVDLALIPSDIEPAGDRGSFELTLGLCRFDGALHGGPGVAAPVMAVGGACPRDAPRGGAFGVVPRFGASRRVGARFDGETRRRAAGRGVSQLWVGARTDDGWVVSPGRGATATPRPDGLDGQYLPMPVVSPPDDSP